MSGISDHVLAFGRWFLCGVTGFIVDWLVSNYDSEKTFDSDSCFMNPIPMLIRKKINRCQSILLRKPSGKPLIAWKTFSSDTKLISKYFRFGKRTEVHFRSFAGAGRTSGMA